MVIITSKIDKTHTRPVGGKVGIGRIYPLRVRIVIGISYYKNILSKSISGKIPV